MLRYAHKEKALSGAMVASSTGSTKFLRILTMEITQVIRWHICRHHVLDKSLLNLMSALVFPIGFLGLCDIFPVLN
jgi:hypothetical protein